MVRRGLVIVGIILIILAIYDVLNAGILYNKNANLVIGDNYMENNVISIQLFPAYSTNFSVIGSYLSDSEYAISEIYSQNQISLFVSPFMWNIKYALGNVNMTFYKNYLHTAINLYKVQKIATSIDVNGYPGLMYGQEDWFPFAARTQESPYLQLPMLVDSLPNFYSILNYSIYVINGSVDDFSYDIWLTQNPNTTYLQYPDIEVMIWMYWSGNLSENPYFVHAGTLNIPTIVNGSVYNYTFQVYVLPRTGSSTGWVGVYFLSPIQKLEGEVGIPIAYVLKNLGSFTTYAGLDFNGSQFYLDAIQVGMEFDNNSNGYSNLGYNLYSWKIEIPMNSSTGLPITTSLITTSSSSETTSIKTTNTLTTSIVTKTVSSSPIPLYAEIVVLIILLIALVSVLLIRKR